MHRYDPSVTICRCPLMSPMCADRRAVRRRVPGLPGRVCRSSLSTDAFSLLVDGRPLPGGFGESFGASGLGGLRSGCQWWPGWRTWRAELACRAGRPGESSHTAGGTPNIFRTFSEHCQTLSGELPAPGRGRGGGTHQFRTFSEHFPNMCRLVLSLRSPSEPGHPPAPNIFRTFSGHYRGIPLPGRGLGNSVQTPRRATLPQPRQSPRQACPEHTSASFNIGGLAGGLVDGPAGPARRFAALAGPLSIFVLVAERQPRSSKVVPSPPLHRTGLILSSWSRH